MQAETLAAIAASAAAVISLVNVAYQAYLEGRKENRKWLRDTLPEAVYRYSDAIFEMSREIVFKTEIWEALAPEERQRRGLEHFAQAMQWGDRPDVEGLQAVKTLVHELAHALLHGDGAARGRDVAEVEVESVAFVVLDALGLASDDYSFPYVARWASGEVEAVRDTASRVIEGSGRILNGLNLPPPNR